MQRISLLLALLLAPACCSDSYTRRTTHHSHKRSSEAQLLRDVAAASVVIQTESALGSGTIIKSNTAYAWVLTCHHVITEDYGTAKTIHVSSPLLSTFRVVMVADDPKHDLALLKVTTNTRAPHIDVADVPPELYERVFLMGNPLGDERLASEAFISSLNERNSELPEERLYTITGGYVQPGISGGTAVNHYGELVCVPSNGRGSGGTMISNMGYCVSWQDIRTFLNKNNFWSE